MLEFGMKKCRARETFEGAKREVESIVLLLQYCSNEGMKEWGKLPFPIQVSLHAYSYCLLLFLLWLLFLF